MPGIDEDIVRELMQRCTDDLHAPSTVTARVIRRQRHRRLRNRALGAVVTGAAAGTAFAVVVSAPCGVPRPVPGHPAATPVRLPGQRHLGHRPVPLDQGQQHRAHDPYPS
jgi:hypothetical protein